MSAELAISSVKVPHNGRYVRCKVVTSKIFETVGAKSGLAYKVPPTLHLEIQRDGGPYLVLRMDRDAALAVAEQMLELARSMPETERTTY